MMLLSPREVAHAAFATFGAKEPVDTFYNAVRIAFAESGVPGRHFVASATGYRYAPSNADLGAADNGFGCCDAQTVNTNTDGSHDYGVWQINSAELAFLGVTDPVRPDGSFEFTSPLFDAARSAAYAYRLFVRAGKAFSPWVSFTNGTYLNFHVEASWGVHLDWCDRHGRPWGWA